MSGTNLMQASYEWASRPADERFESIDLLYLHCLGAAWGAKEQVTDTNKLLARDVDGDVRLVHNGGELRFNHWSFGQLARRVGAPSDWLRKTPADLAVKSLNWALQNAKDDDREHRTQLWFDGKTNLLRAATGEGYGRILNHQVVKAVIDMGSEWLTPPARPSSQGAPGARKATEADCKGSNHPDLGIKPGDWISPAGLYGGDRNIFLFRVNPQMRLDDGSQHGLGRGFFVRNSEVGDAFFELVAFWYRYVCGNHIVWGAEQVIEKKIKHSNTAQERAFASMADDIEKMSKADLSEDAAFLKRARQTELGPSQDDVTELVWRDKRILPTKRLAEAAWDLAVENERDDGAPNTAWGFAQGITRLSQRAKYADERTRLDRAAGEILAFANN